MKPPPQWKQARELAASPDSYGEDGRMLPEVIGSHSWRGFAICPACGTAEEF
jgi:hypothetical protein